MGRPINHARELLTLKTRLIGEGRSNAHSNTFADRSDRSHIKNDRELHELLHTRLLSSVYNPSIALAESSAKRKKTLEGRILELASKSKLGKGEKDVRKAERKKALLRIREGMKAKDVTRAKQNLEDVSSLRWLTLMLTIADSFEFRPRT